MARGESRKRKPGTPDYRKRFWAAVTAIVVAAGSIGCLLYTSDAADD